MAFPYYFACGKEDRQIRALVGTDRPPVKCRDADAEGKPQDQQDAEPLASEKESDEFLDRVHRCDLFVKSNTPIGRQAQLIFGK